MSRHLSFSGMLGGKRASVSKKSPDGEWRIGGRYEVSEASYLYDNPKLSGPEVFEVKCNDVVLLLRHQISNGSVVGFVVAPTTDGQQRVAGWIPLQAVRQSRLEDSWEMGARYRVKHPSTLRANVNLSSAVIKEIQPLREVLILELGVHHNPEVPAQTRLRLKVCLCALDGGVNNSKWEAIGWLSAETGAGDKLLDQTDLLSIDAVKLHRASVGGARSSAMMRLSARNSVSLTTIPWEAGGKYRVLEKLQLRESAELNSKKVSQLSPGASVMVNEIHMTECPFLGRCPIAYVEEVQDATKQYKKGHKRHRGWCRCAGKDGRNLLCERDQLECDKINAHLRAAAQKKLQVSTQPSTGSGAAQKQAARDPNDEDNSDEWTDGSYEDEESESEEGDSEYEEGSPKSPAKSPAQSPDSAKKLPAAAKSASKDNPADAAAADALAAEQDRKKEEDFGKKLQAMEIGAKEDKMVDDKTIIQDKGFCGACGCGAQPMK